VLIRALNLIQPDNPGAIAGATHFRGPQRLSICSSRYSLEAIGGTLQYEVGPAGRVGGDTLARGCTGRGAAIDLVLAVLLEPAVSCSIRALSTGAGFWNLKLFLHLGENTLVGPAFFSSALSVQLDPFAQQLVGEARSERWRDALGRIPLSSGRPGSCTQPFNFSFHLGLFRKQRTWVGAVFRSGGQKRKKTKIASGAATLSNATALQVDLDVIIFVRRGLHRLAVMVESSASLIQPVFACRFSHHRQLAQRLNKPLISGLY